MKEGKGERDDDDKLNSIWRRFGRGAPVRATQFLGMAQYFRKDMGMHAADVSARVITASESTTYKESRRML